MALAFINDSFAVNASGGTTTGTRPTGVGSGHLLLAKWDIYDVDATATALPSGWTSILNNFHSTSQGDITTKIGWADGAAGVAFAGPAHYTNLYLMGYSGQLAATPIDSGSGAPTWNPGQSGTCTGTGLTVTDNGSILVFMMTGYGNGLSSGPSGMTAREANYDGVNNVYELAVNAGATGNKTASLTASDSWAVGMFAVRPAGAAPAASLLARRCQPADEAGARETSVRRYFLVSAGTVGPAAYVLGLPRRPWDSPLVDDVRQPRAALVSPAPAAYVLAAARQLRDERFADELAPRRWALVDAGAAPPAGYVLASPRQPFGEALREDALRARAWLVGPTAYVLVRGLQPAQEPKREEMPQRPATRALPSPLTIATLAASYSAWTAAASASVTSSSSAAALYSDWHLAASESVPTNTGNLTAWHTCFGPTQLQ